MKNKLIKEQINERLLELVKKIVTNSLEENELQIDRDTVAEYVKFSINKFELTNSRLYLKLKCERGYFYEWDEDVRDYRQIPVLHDSHVLTRYFEIKLSNLKYYNIRKVDMLIQGSYEGLNSSIPLNLNI